MSADTTDLRGSATSAARGWADSASPAGVFTVDALSLDDAPAVQCLVNAASIADGTGEQSTLEEVHEWLTTPGVDLSADSVALREGGVLRGFGIVDLAQSLTFDGRARVRLFGDVDPEHRGRGIGTQILTWQVRRGQQLIEQKRPGVPGRIEASGGLPEAPARRLLDHAGFAHVRDFIEMRLEFADDPVRHRPPGGPDDADTGDDLQILSPGTDHREAVREAHNQAFADHWGSAPMGEARWRAMWSSSTARSELSSIAVDASGEVVSYVVAEQGEGRTLYVALVGTRPSARGRGLARRLLQRTVELARSSGGFDAAELGVDADSLTGATRLYEALGFRATHVFGSYALEVSPA